jgi:integrase
MAKTVTVMSAKEVERLSKVQGMHRVDSGLYLQCKGNAVSWLGRYTFNGKPRWPGYGAYPATSLAEARARRNADRDSLHNGADPVAQREAARTAEKEAEKLRKKFKAFAESYIADNESSWKNPVHRKQWTSSLQTYAFPKLGDLFLDEITESHIVDALRSIWTTKRETAARVRGRVEKILAAAKVLGLRAGDNPAARESITMVLPKRGKKEVKHHPALPWKIMPQFMAELRAIESVSARALEFAILTACRTGDLLGQRGRDDRAPMKWADVDFGARLWIIPKTKTDGEHRVPLTGAAIACLRAVEGLDPELVFPSPDKPGQALSNGAMDACLARMGHSDVTVHGMRSTFRDWAGDRTSFERDLIEFALAHTLPSAVEAAYRRSTVVEKRRRLMDAWAGYCAKPPAAGNVVTLAEHQKAAS